MEAAPYDNVEFGPVGRAGGTGTWPGPQGHQQHQTARALHQQQTTAATKGLLGGVGAGGARLAPLEESAEIAESHDQRMQAVTQQAASFSSSSSSATSSTSHAQRTAAVGAGGVSGGSVGGGGGSTVHGAAGQSKLLTMSSFGTTSTSPSTLTTTTASKPTTTTSSYKPSTTTATSNNSKAAEKSSTKAQSAPTYMLTQVGSGGVKDTTSTLRTSDDDDDFKRHDLDPQSRAVLEAAFTRHNEFYRLNSKVLDEGALLKQDVLDIYRKAGETFSYEQLLQGMLVDGEMLLLGGCWLHYMHVEFKDESGESTVRQPYGRGRLCLTNHRVLLLSADIYTDADLHPYGEPKKDGGYKLEVSKRSAVVFRNLPLTCFHSADLEINIGTSAQTKITSRPAPCCGLCSCFACGCCGPSWHSTAPMTRSFNERVVRMGVALPPWGARSVLVLHLDPGQSLTTARDFIAQLHQHAPNMH